MPWAIGPRPSSATATSWAASRGSTFCRSVEENSASTSRCDYEFLCNRSGNQLPRNSSLAWVGAWLKLRSKASWPVRFRPSENAQRRVVQGELASGRAKSYPARPAILRTALTSLSARESVMFRLRGRTQIESPGPRFLNRPQPRVWGFPLRGASRPGWRAGRRRESCTAGRGS